MDSRDSDETHGPSGEVLVPERTEDGSYTLRSARFGQAYHSRHGAVTESLHVFLGAGFQHRLNAPGALRIRILELGLGTGLNALLTLATWRKLPEARQPQLEYIALEPIPLDGRVLSGLELASDAGVQQSDVDALHARPGAPHHQVAWDQQGRFTRLSDDWQAFAAATDLSFDLIYYDAFAPDSQPELWSEDRFKEAFLLLEAGGALVTYCAKGSVRRALEAAGFITERLPGPPGKREMLRATKPVDGLAPLKRFNVRVYFFLLDGDQVLLSDERIAGQSCTKWPGGGLEFGEGPLECVCREAMEELGQSIEPGALVHATGGFVRSAWRPDEQVLCHYYLAKLSAPARFPTADSPMDFSEGRGQSLRWVHLQTFDEQGLTFATDREACSALKAHLGIQ